MSLLLYPNNFDSPPTPFSDFDTGWWTPEYSDVLRKYHKVLELALPWRGGPFGPSYADAVFPHPGSSVLEGPVAEGFFAQYERAFFPTERDPGTWYPGSYEF